MSKQASEWAPWSTRAKQAMKSKRMSEHCEQKSKWKSKWPSTLLVNFIYFPPSLLNRDVCTGPVACLLTHHVYSFACSAMLASLTYSTSTALTNLFAHSLARSTALTHLLTRSLTQLLPSLRKDVILMSLRLWRRLRRVYKQADRWTNPFQMHGQVQKKQKKTFCWKYAF